MTDLQPLGEVTVDAGMLTIADPSWSRHIARWWRRALRRDAPELFGQEFAEVTVPGPRGTAPASAVLVSTHDDGTWMVEGRFCVDGHRGRLEVCEVRLLLHGDCDNVPATAPEGVGT